MAEDGGGPATRLRRRLSLELTEEVPSPATPSKGRRGAKLAAKPQLDNIAENAIINSPKRPVRRSIRGTSELPEETISTPTTPLKRSLRINSNTSITSDAVQNVGSPRALRAARRVSVGGSDNEAPTTPAQRSRRISLDTTEVKSETKTTRRTRKTSTLISESPIMEETKQNADIDNISPSSTRKSPRLISKKVSPKNCDTCDGDTKLEKTKTDKETTQDISPIKTQNDSEKKLEQSMKISKDQQNDSYSAVDNADISPNSKRKRAKSLSSVNRKLSLENSFLSDNESRKTKMRSVKKQKAVSALNSSIEKGIGDYKTTKDTSTEIFKVDENKENDISTDILIKLHERKKRLSETKNENIQSCNTSIELNQKASEDVNLIIFNTPIAKIHSTIHIDDSDSNSETVKANPSKPDEVVNTDDQCVPVVNHVTEIKIDQEVSKIEMNDSLNTSKKRSKKASVSFNIETLVEPVQTDKKDQSWEPMDIDETMPENVSLLDTSDEKNKEKDDSKKANIVPKSPKEITETNQDKVDSPIIVSNHGSPQKKKKIGQSNNTFGALVEQQDNKETSPSKMYIQGKSDKSLVQDKTSEQNVSNVANKSTLILSMKDNSDASKHNVTDNSKRRRNSSKTEVDSASNSLNISTKELRKNQSIELLNTGTPLQNKALQKIGMTTSTPVNIKQNVNKAIDNDVTEISKDDINQISPKAKKDLSNISEKSKDKSRSKPSDVSMESDDNTKSSNVSSENNDGSACIDDEAQDAGDDYESGDSLNDSERKYMEANEIPVGGVTLDSQDDISDRSSDYEKDSFIVTSDEEDEQLLSGSGDDLSLTDNELKMTAKSKKKFDERKSKEQKKASREMYEARHQKKIELLQDDSESDVPVNKAGKKKRARIDSTIESIETSKIEKPGESSDDPDIFIKNPKSKNRQRIDSVKEVQADEKEITINSTSLNETKDPLSMTIKRETVSFLEQSKLNKTAADIENVNINEDVSMFVLHDKSKDPLIEDSDSDISENEVISENFTSLLKTLQDVQQTEDVVDATKVKSKKSANKSLDHSLRSKKDLNESVIDKLNITQTKKQKLKNTMNLENSLNSSTENPNLTELNKSKKKKNKSISESEIVENENPLDVNKEDLIVTDPEKTKKNKVKSISVSETIENVSEVSNKPKNKKSQKASVSLHEFETKTSNMEKNCSLTENLNLTSSGKVKKRKTKLDNGNLPENATELETAKENFESCLADKTKGKAKKNKANKAMNDEETARDGFEGENEDTAKGSTAKTKKNKCEKENFETNGLTNKSNKGDLVQIFTADSTDSSNSVDFKLLFSNDEESRDSSKGYQEKVIPLKKSPGKINLLENIEKQNVIIETINSEISKQIFESQKKKKDKNKSIEMENVPVNLNLSQSGKKKKISENSEIAEQIDSVNESISKKSSAKKRKRTSLDESQPQTINKLTDKDTTEPKASKDVDLETSDYRKQKHKKHVEVTLEEDTTITNKERKSRKRKASDGDLNKEQDEKPSAIRRLPSSLIEKLDDELPIQKPKKLKPSIVSTSQFVVEPSTKRTTKPSHYLEQSILIDNSRNFSNFKKPIKSFPRKPKLLKSIPTASTSISGYTTNFLVNVLPEPKQSAVCKAYDFSSFKVDRLYGKKIKRVDTTEVFKKFKGIGKF